MTTTPQHRVADGVLGAVTGHSGVRHHRGTGPGAGTESANPGTCSTGFSAFIRALASAPEIDLELAARHRQLDAGGVVVGGTYAIGERLGQGGLGMVYRAHDEELDRPVAVKVLRLETLEAGVRGELIQLLEREALATAALNHPNLITVHRFGVWEGLPFMVVELLSGESLRARLARGPVPPAEAVAIVDQILAGLEHAHGQGVLHRDLSPGNVFVRADGVVKVLDFGMSSVRAAVMPPSAAVSGTTLLGGGTPGYMAPEQQRGEPVDARADLWSVGVLLDHMLRGGSSGRTAVPARLAAFVTRACAPAPAERFPDAAAMRAALPRPRPPGRRRRTVARTAALVVAIAVALALGLGAAGPPARAPTIEPLAFMRTHAADARVVSPAEAPPLEGVYRIAGPTAGVDQPELELRRTAHGYHETFFSMPSYTGDVDVVRAGDRFYLVARRQLRVSQYVFEQRIETATVLVRSFEGWSDPGRPIVAFSTSPVRYERLAPTGTVPRPP